MTEEKIFCINCKSHMYKWVNKSPWDDHTCKKRPHPMNYVTGKRKKGYKICKNPDGECAMYEPKEEQQND